MPISLYIIPPYLKTLNKKIQNNKKDMVASHIHSYDYQEASKEKIEGGK